MHRVHESLFHQHALSVLDGNKSQRQAKFWTSPILIPTAPVQVNGRGVAGDDDAALIDLHRDAVTRDPDLSTCCCFQDERSCDGPARKASRAARHRGGGARGAQTAGPELTTPLTPPPGGVTRALQRATPRRAP